MSDMQCVKCGKVLTLTESVRGGVCNDCLIATGETKMRGNILLSAHKTINGQRVDIHGQPEDCFNTIAKLWSIWIGKELTAHDAAVMLNLMKVARMKHGAGSIDSYVDACGYIALAADIYEKQDAAD